MFKRIKEAIKKFLDNLAQENEKSFGKGTLDCCQINRQGNDSSVKRQ